MTTKRQLLSQGFECRSGHINSGKFKYLIVFHCLPEISHVVDADAFRPMHLYLRGTLERKDGKCVLGYGQTAEEAWDTAIERSLD